MSARQVAEHAMRAKGLPTDNGHIVGSSRCRFAWRWAAWRIGGWWCGLSPRRMLVGAGIGVAVCAILGAWETSQRSIGPTALTSTRIGAPER
jgi:hypothetical protein